MVSRVAEKRHATSPARLTAVVYVAVASEPRDLEVVRAGLERWLRTREPDAVIGALSVPDAGLSSETCFAPVRSAAGTRELVVRLPPAGAGLFPEYRLDVQVAVQEAVADLGVRAVRAEWIDDPTWLGGPFMVMPRVEGNPVARSWALKGWIVEADVGVRRSVFLNLVDELARLHQCTIAHEVSPPEPLSVTVDRWVEYFEWASGDREPPAFMREACDWCVAEQPQPHGITAILWGDVQVTNAIFGPDGSVRALLDWEMAGHGVPELDLGWYVALHEMTLAQVGSVPEGVPRRTEIVDRYVETRGREIDALRWYEAFALFRSGSIMVRMARLLADQGVDDGWLLTHNPTVAAFDQVIARRE